MRVLLRRLFGKGSRTVPYPSEGTAPPAAFRGRPVADLDGCDRCGRCADACPAGSLSLVDEGLQLDLGSCIFCGECARVCPDHIIMGNDFELAAKSREEMKVVFARG
jgi:hydrogenase-4 component H